MSYDRPSRGTKEAVESYWAQVEKPDPKNDRRSLIVCSPTFYSAYDLHQWIAAHRGGLVYAYRRDSRGRDHSLDAPE